MECGTVPTQLLAPGAADANGGLQEMRQALLAPGASDASGGLQEMCQALLAPGAVDASGVSNLQLTQCRLSSLRGSDDCE